jgi:hypothetical protein
LERNSSTRVINEKEKAQKGVDKRKRMDKLKMLPLRNGFFKKHLKKGLDKREKRIKLKIMPLRKGGSLATE